MDLKSREHWDIGALELSPQKGMQKNWKSTIYNMKEGHDENLMLESTNDEWSSSGDWSSII